MEKNYYYLDPVFQMEINLHNVRKELLSMMGFYEGTGCESCSLLKCKCTKNGTKSTNTNARKSNNRTYNKSPSDTEPYTEEAKVRIQLTAGAVDAKRDKTDFSPLSSPEKKTDAKVIEAWLETCKNEDSVAEKLIQNSKNSLVTIESVRPADLPLKILQTSCVLNPSSLLNCSSRSNGLNIPNVVHDGTLEAYSNLKPQVPHTQAYMNAILAATRDRQTKQKYTCSYF